MLLYTRHFSASRCCSRVPASAAYPWLAGGGASRARAFARRASTASTARCRLSVCWGACSGAARPTPRELSSALYASRHRSADS
eukprot:1182687-Prorocentrum_minimum.AAC.2